MLTLLLLLWHQKYYREEKNYTLSRKIIINNVWSTSGYDRYMGMQNGTKLEESLDWILIFTFNFNIIHSLSLLCFLQGSHSIAMFAAHSLVNVITTYISGIHAYKYRRLLLYYYCMLMHSDMSS